jgi:hypothetical protein
MEVTYDSTKNEFVVDYKSNSGCPMKWIYDNTAENRAHLSSTANYQLDAEAHKMVNALYVTVTLKGPDVQLATKS